jgi:hypothetical protein
MPAFQACSQGGTPDLSGKPFECARDLQRQDRDQRDQGEAVNLFPGE